MNTFARGRMEALATHPTTKPVALVADALLDSTTKGEAVLDQFAGSGTTIFAAEKVGRIAYALEFEPRFVDAAIGRWQHMTKLEATLAGDGRTFEEIATARGGGAQSHGSGLRGRQADQGGRLRSTRDRLPDRSGRDSESRHG